MEPPPSVTIHSPRESKHEECDNDNHRTLKSCCFSIDKEALSFFAQYAVLLSIAGFSMYQIGVRSPCDTPVFIGLLSTVLGIAVPSPKYERKR